MRRSSRSRRCLSAGSSAPGDRLPPEKELSERLGLSRNSLREAVRALELIRVLDVRRGDGRYVTSLEPSLLLEAMTFVDDLHNDASVLHLFEVRRIVEPVAAEMATARANPHSAAGFTGATTAISREATDIATRRRGQQRQCNGDDERRWWQQRRRLW